MICMIYLKLPGGGACNLIDLARVSLDWSCTTQILQNISQRQVRA